MAKLACFKAYDIRGRLGESLDEDIAYRIGRAYGHYLGDDKSPRTIVVGCDCRLSSESLKQALAQGIMDAGLDVIDLGLTGTEEVYFATFHLGVEGGIEVTASHNPMDYNGMKLVRRGARPVSGDTGLRDIQRLAEANEFPVVEQKGSLRRQSCLQAYVEHLCGYVDLAAIKPLKLVVNAGNGVAGHVIDALEPHFQQAGVPVAFIKVHHEPDGTFPNGIPNPLLPERREATQRAVLAHQADMGIAWDGDFDRCFLFDEQGNFIEGYYIVGLLAEMFLRRHAGEKVIHDPRSCWNTQAVASEHGGQAVQSKTGHAFIKERMRAENAVYGGEMSAHHYFRDFAYCDSGMIPWLLVAELLSVSGKPLSELVQARMAAFPCSGELNFRVDDAKAITNTIRQHYLQQGGEGEQPDVDETDGLSMAFAQWRFNLRSSNTEPLLRLNVESRGDQGLMERKTAELVAMIGAGG